MARFCCKIKRLLAQLPDSVLNHWLRLEAMWTPVVPLQIYTKCKSFSVIWNLVSLFLRNMAYSSLFRAPMLSSTAIMSASNPWLRAFQCFHSSLQTLRDLKDRLLTPNNYWMRFTYHFYCWRKEEPKSKNEKREGGGPGQTLQALRRWGVWKHCMRGVCGT